MHRIFSNIGAIVDTVALVDLLFTKVLSSLNVPIGYQIGLIVALTLYSGGEVILREIGPNGIRCSWVKAYRYKLHNLNGKLLCIMHKHIYHEYSKVLNKVEKMKTENRGEQEIKEVVECFISKMNTALNVLFGMDLSISVKLLEHTNGNSILKPYIFLKSSIERDSGKSRSVTNNYLLIDGSSMSLSSLTEVAEQYNKAHGCGGYYKNYVMSHDERFYMSNDLEQLKKVGSFFTSSSNYEQGFYKSLAAFAIAPPAENEKTVNVRGLLIFDSPEKYLFSDRECQFIMGLFAHQLYDIIKIINSDGKKQ